MANNQIFDRVHTFSEGAGFSPGMITKNLGRDVLGDHADGAKAAVQVGAESFVLLNVGTIIGQVVIAGGIIFALLMLYASFLWMTAQGSEEKVTKAQKIFITSIIGVFILTSAAAISYTVIAYFSGNQDLIS